jgi:DNA-binding transcriptional MerR regulator
MKHERHEYLTIGELAESAGVATSTIRFYERRGLLAAAARTRSNYRTYSSSSLKRLKFIRSSQERGFSLKDIREMLGLAKAEHPPCSDVQELIENRLAAITEQLNELEAIKQKLLRVKGTCCDKSADDLCSRIQHLSGRTSCP